jgi:hypothetical protein
MYYIIQEAFQHEREEWKDLIHSLERLELSYEIIKVLPFTDEIEFKTEREDIFCFGGLKLARLSKKQNWYPGCVMTHNHNFNVYKNYYKENLLNYNSKIFKFSDDFEWDGDFFVRPVLDSKVFTGKVFSPEDWRKERDRLLNNLKKDRENGLITTSLTEATEIQVTTVKCIEKEFRFWIVNGEIVTSSLYRTGCFINYSDVVDTEATEFCKQMMEVFQLAEAFVMDVCLTDGEWKIIECGCINCAGFYRANIPKLLMAVEDFYNENYIEWGKRLFNN